MSEDRNNDVLHDERLSEAYRALSTEQTSAQLDKAVLDMARVGAPKRSLSRLLAIKPLAWGATVVLTVTLVVHLQQLEVADTLIFEDEVAADLDDSATATRQDADSPSSADLSSFAPAAGARAKIQEVEAMIVEQEPADSSLREAAESSVSLKRERLQSAPQPRYCGPTETADASSWYQCILDLEKEGKLEEAAAEKTRLFSEYPDFQVR